MTRGRGDTGTRSALCPVPRVQGDKPQGSSSPIKICDLMAADWWAPQAPPHRYLRVSPSPRLRVSPSPRLPLSASPRLPLSASLLEPSVFCLQLPLLSSIKSHLRLNSYIAIDRY